MAYSLETLRSQRKTSIHGRRLGLDSNGYLVGPPAIREQVEDLTTTAASSLSPYGLSRLMATGSTQTGDYTLQAPVIGVQKKIFLQSTSSGCQLVRLSGSALVMGDSLTTAGSTVINFLKQGANITLNAVSSVLWLVTGGRSSLVSSDGLGYSYTTST